MAKHSISILSYYYSPTINCLRVQYCLIKKQLMHRYSDFVERCGRLSDNQPYGCPVTRCNYSQNSSLEVVGRCGKSESGAATAVILVSTRDKSGKKVSIAAGIWTWLLIICFQAFVYIMCVEAKILVSSNPILILNTS